MSQLRKNVRLRKEYLYKKAQEKDEAARFEKRQKIKDALAEGKKLPPELREEAEKLKYEMEIDDPTVSKLSTHVDDEYQRVGLYDPKVLITSARDPSVRLVQFIKELRLCFPNAQRVNRGNTQINELADLCRNNDYTDLVIVHEHRGEPDGLIISHFPYGPTAYFSLTNCVLRHDIDQDLGTVSEAAPHLIFHNFSSQLGSRVTSIIQALFPSPKPDTRRIMSFINRDDVVSFRHHVYKKNTVGAKDEDGNLRQPIELAEVGPRFEMKIYHIKLGTAEMKEAETEWVLKSHYKRTARQSQL